MPQRLSEKLLSWATDIDDQTIRQAQATARLSIIADHVALMPDAHLGKGATIGSVIATEGAIIPAAVGVDLGCGMIAVETSLMSDNLPDDLDGLLGRIDRAVPAGVGRGHEHSSRRADQWLATHKPATRFSAKQSAKALSQFGSLGSGNHFVEVCLDERDIVWVMLHSGSRGIGNELAQMHISAAKRSAREAMLSLEDPDLAYVVQGTEEFDAYIADMSWAQDYALANREVMMDATLEELFSFVGSGRELARTNCHHNFAARETHGGRDLWVTRKGAIRARVGDTGIIPGSMGTSSYIIEGLGNRESFESCSHGAGRRMSRNQAKREFSTEDLAAQMGDRTWLSGRASRLVDEIPSAYKDIDSVMEAQTDLVKITHQLRQVLNYKGT